MKIVSMLYLRQWQRFTRLDRGTRVRCAIAAALAVVWWVLMLLAVLGVIS
jgi:hypothetical protein